MFFIDKLYNTTMSFDIQWPAENGNLKRHPESGHPSFFFIIFGNIFRYNDIQRGDRIIVS
jgi:predicted NUDIX family NTP pyrophosphohydrolase